MWGVAIIFFLILAIFGPIGIIVAGIGIWLYIENENSKNRDSQTNQNVSSSNTTSQPHTHNEQVENNLTIEQFAPLIDIICTYALKYETSWTPEKVRFVKNIFHDFCVTEEDEAFLKNKLKAQYRRQLSSLIQLWLNQNPSLDDRQYISQMVIILMINTCENFETAQKESIEFGKMIGLDEYDCYMRFMSIVQETEHYHNTNSHEHMNNQEQSKTKLELSAEILGITLPATRDEIQKAYRMKIKDYHPDRNINVTPAVKMMLEEQAHRINEARDYLLEYSK